MLTDLYRRLDPLPSHLGDEHISPLFGHRLMLLALALGAVSYVLLFITWTVAPVFGSAVHLRSSLPMVLMLLGAVTAGLTRNRPRMAALVLLGSALWALYYLPPAIRDLFGPPMVCAAMFLGGRCVGVFSAAVMSALPGTHPLAMGAIWVTVAVVWLSMDYICAALAQASARQERALRLERELLARREELRRLNDSLHTAYALLERTNRELADARDEAEEARRLKDQFAATISHELRTPLNLILGFTEVMHTAPESYGAADLPTELRGDIREVYRNTRHLLDLVDDVLDLSRIEQVRLALVPEDSDLLALIREATATVAGLFRGKPVELVVDLPAELPHCTVDRTRIRQVLINLLANAARFTERGEVRVEAAYDEARREVVVSVSDTGRGIPEGEQERVFQPFHQAASSLYRHKGGSGLGLAICRTFVQMHGGRIWVRSEEGKGSRFTFALPVRATPPSARSDWRPAGVAQAVQDSIVTVDPSGAMARLVERALPQFRIHNVRDVKEVRKATAEDHPKAVVAFTPGEAESAVDELLEAAPWPGLPLVGCRLRDRRPLGSFPNVRAVLTKPATQSAVLDALGFVNSGDTVVLADDDEGMTRLVQRTLARSSPGVQVLAAYDGEQALGLIRAHRPDAVLLDLAMPGRDGLYVLQAMSEEDLAHIPVVVLTAMDIKGAEGNVAVERLVLSTCTGLSELELVRYIEAVATAARPRYVGEGRIER